MSLFGVSVGPAGEIVTVEMVDGPARFHALWLRDNARDDSSRHGGNDQRLFDVTELADEVTVASAEVVDGRLVVVFGPDGATSTYDEAWLEANRYDGPGPARTDWLRAGRLRGVQPCRGRRLT